jgi:hypothetical protein
MQVCLRLFAFKHSLFATPFRSNTVFSFCGARNKSFEEPELGNTLMMAPEVEPRQARRRVSWSRK